MYTVIRGDVRRNFPSESELLQWMWGRVASNYKVERDGVPHKFVEDVHGTFTMKVVPDNVYKK